MSSAASSPAALEGIFVAPVPRLGTDSSIYRNSPATAAASSSSESLPISACRAFARVAAHEVAASRDVTQHLLGLGHRRIAFLAGPTLAPSAPARLEGYRRALRDAGVEIHDRLVFDARSTIDEGYQAGLELVRESLGVTALQAVNDLVAIGALNALVAQGIRIPEDVSVAGFGNLLTAENARVALTTVREPKFRLGMAAMEVMQQLLKGGPP